MRNPEEIDPDWARYAETILVFEGDPAFEVDLREPLTAEAVVQFRDRGFAQTFGILTAHDPFGRALSTEENRQRQAELESELAKEGVHFARVDACSVDRQHCECSLAIDVNQAKVIEIAERYEQLAVFWYDADAVWLIGALVKSDPFRLPRSA